MGRSKDSYIDQIQKGLPDQADVYTVPELTEFSTGFMLENTDDFVHTVFPSVSVKKQSGKYRRYAAASLYRNKMERRTDGAESAGGGFETDTADFSTEVWAWHTDIGPQLRANADGSADIDTVATEECSTAALINREAQWVANFWGSGLWDTEFTFNATPAPGQRLSWADDDSTPVKDMRDLLYIQRRKAKGRRANKVVFSEDVWERLLVHPEMRTLWGGGQTPGGPTMGDPGVFRTQLARLLEVQEIKIAKALYTTSEDGDPNETYDVIVTTGVGFFYAPPTPSIMTPSAGYQFNWTGYTGAGGQGQVITRETIPLTKGSQRFEIEQAYGMEQVSSECGGWFENVLDLP
jgi:hypothetical protein